MYKGVVPVHVETNLFSPAFSSSGLLYAVISSHSPRHMSSVFPELLGQLSGSEIRRLCLTHSTHVLHQRTASPNRSSNSSVNGRPLTVLL